jgi:uncharacterized membrane protein YjjP (DUF1212 family)
MQASDAFSRALLRSLCVRTANMNIEERSAFVLTAAKALYVNGQSTGHTVEAAERLAHTLGLR